MDKEAKEIYHRFINYEWNDISKQLECNILDAIKEGLNRKGNCKILTPEEVKTLTALAHSLTVIAPEIKKEMLATLTNRI